VLGRADECPGCHWDAHVCLNCQFFDKNAHHECREPEADYVKEKDEANFCDYFSPKGSQAHGNAGLDKAKSDLEKLFSGGKTPATSEKKTSSLEEDLKKFLNKK
jgi:hypothetical protein